MAKSPGLEILAGLESTDVDHSIEVEARTDGAYPNGRTFSLISGHLSFSEAEQRTNMNDEARSLAGNRHSASKLVRSS